MHSIFPGYVLTNIFSFRENPRRIVHGSHRKYRIKKKLRI